MSTLSFWTSRRRLLGAAATAGVVGLMPAALRAAPAGDAIRPFRVNVPHADLDDLRRRGLATRWPANENVPTQCSGLSGRAQAENSPGELTMKPALMTLIAATAALYASTTMAQTAGEVLGPAGVVPLTTPQPPAKIIVDPPLAEPLSHGMVFIQYRAENLRIVPVFGPNALDVSPRIGHIHVIVDDGPWHWADTSGEPLILVGLQGPDHPGKREPSAP
jgi:hypothetical protein